ncbi:RING/U-box superfamily protein [Euphorbia peplus]|nr:RING/U-box superfamily protein [Euphorbia peplus]
MVTQNISVRMQQFRTESAPEHPRLPSQLKFVFRFKYQTAEKVMCITEEDDNRIIPWSTWINDEAVEITFKTNLHILRNRTDIVYQNLRHKFRTLGIESHHHWILFTKIIESVGQTIQTNPNILNEGIMGVLLDIVSCTTYLVQERELMLEASRAEFERQNYGMIPAAKEAIEMILNSDKVVTEKEDCGICLEEITEIGAGMPCDHVFHKNCIEKWLNISHLCPLCRSELPVTLV